MGVNMKTKILIILTLTFSHTLSWANPNDFAKADKNAFAKSSTEPSIESKAAIPSPSEVEFFDKWHRRMTYLTAGLAAGAIATHEEKKKAKESHEILGTATALSFFTASYFAWAAPKVPGAVETRSQKYHRYLGYALVPLMIALPLAGIDANKDYEDGKTSADGMGKNKGSLTGITVAALAASTLTLYFEF